MWSRLVILAELVYLLIVAENIEGRVAHIAAGTPVLRDGFIPFPDIGAAYKYFNATRTWNSARKTYIEYNSTLAVIDSWRKIDHIQSIRANNNNGVWIGIHKLFGDAEWVGLETGLPLATAALPWAPTTNDGYHYLNCLRITFQGSGIKAESCAEEANFICGIPLPTDWNELTLSPGSTAIPYH